MAYRTLLWKIPLAVTGIVVGAVMLLLVAVTCVVSIPPLRNAAAEKGIAIASEQTGLDIDLGRFNIHLSPLRAYRAWRGKTDLPLALNIDSLYIGHRGQDTLVYVHCLRLNAKLLTAQRSDSDSGIMSCPIVVERLQLEQTTFHSDSMIAAVGIDVVVGHLALTSPELNIARGQFPLHGLQLSDAFIGIDLRETPPDTTALDTTPLLMAFDVPDGVLRNIHFALTPIGLDISTRSLQTPAA